MASKEKTEYVADVISALIDHCGDVQNMPIQLGGKIACQFCRATLKNHGQLDEHKDGCLFHKVLAIKGLK